MNLRTSEPRASAHAAGHLADDKDSAQLPGRQRGATPDRGSYYKDGGSIQWPRTAPTLS
ncbi:hypothetical protein [Streptomyces decoyicus]